MMASDCTKCLMYETNSFTEWTWDSKNKGKKSVSLFYIEPFLGVLQIIRIYKFALTLSVCLSRVFERLKVSFKFYLNAFMFEKTLNGSEQLGHLYVYNIFLNIILIFPYYLLLYS